MYCNLCGKEFEEKGKYCSDECRKEIKRKKSNDCYYKNYAPSRIRTCVQCEKEFEWESNTQNTCSPECKYERKKFIDREWMRQKRAKDPDCKLKDKKWKQNPEYKKKQCEYEKERRKNGLDWRSNHKEESREYDKKYFQDNKEKLMNWSKEYSRKNPEYAKRMKMLSKNRKYGVDHEVPDVKTIRKRMNIFKGCCYCGTKEKLTMEHLMPISKGGDHSENNLFGACFSCNSSKQDRDFKEWYRKQSFYDKKREYNILQNTLAG